MKAAHLKSCGLIVASAFVLNITVPAETLSTPRLSDAMKSAASGDKTPIEGTNSEDSGTRKSHASHDSLAASMTGELADEVAFPLVEGFISGFLRIFHGSYYKDTKFPWHFPLDAEYSSPLKGNIQSITRYSLLPLSIENEKWLLGFYFNGGTVNMKNDSLPSAATRNGWTIGTGISIRRYLIGPEKPLNPFFTAKFGWQSLNWDYRNPIVLIGGDTVSRDRIEGCDSYVGVGLAFMRDKPVSGFVELGYGSTFLRDRTARGFSDNVFQDYDYYSVKVGLSFKF